MRQKVKGIVRKCEDCMNFKRQKARIFVEEGWGGGKMPTALSKALKLDGFVYFCKLGCEDRIRMYPKAQSRGCRMFDHWATEPVCGK